MPDTPFSTPTEVRRAPATEAAQACEVVRQSITHCCALDHQHNLAVLAAWLANKTADHLAAWMAAPHAMAWGAYRGGERGSDRSAEQASTMVGFALLMQDKLALCYVVTQALHQGVGRALLLAAEEGARQAGIAALVLESTRTADAFYRRHGYEPAGAAQAWAGLQAQPMCKQL